VRATRRAAELVVIPVAAQVHAAHALASTTTAAATPALLARGAIPAATTAASGAHSTTAIGATDL
jgi:hypothetical protein